MTPEERARAIELEAEAELEAVDFGKMREQYAERKAKATPDEWYEDLGEGLAVSGMETYYGLKDLVGKMTDEDRATLKDWKDDAAESGWGTAGQIIGDIGQTVLPGGAALKVLKGAGKIKQITGAMRFGTDLLASAGLGGIQAPSEGENRLVGAAQGAGGALLGGALGRVASKFGRGLNVTDEAKQLMGEGIELTPGQASQSPLWRGVENILSLKPGAAGGTRELRDRALAQWNLKVLNEVRAPGAKKLETIGFDAQDELYNGFTKAYKDAWAKATKPSDTKLIDLVDSMQPTIARLDDASQRVMDNITDDILELGDNFSPERMRAIDNSLRRASKRANSSANPNPDLDDALKALRDKFRETVSKETREELQKIDPQYRKYLTARKAANESAEGASGTFTPQDLRRSARRKGGEALSSRGQSPLQADAEVAMATLGRKEPQPIMDVRKALSRNIISPTPLLSAGGRFMFGETAPQKAVASLGRSKLAEALRRLNISSANVMGAYQQENE